MGRRGPKCRNTFGLLDRSDLLYGKYHGCDLTGSQVPTAAYWGRIGHVWQFTDASIRALAEVYSLPDIAIWQAHYFKNIYLYFYRYLFFY